ncbi:MAG: hypothetical protein OXI64_09630, partial [Defluviicoccus sp.]|nr:hypothetical protein [Defluviicoccus sp.]
GMLSMITPPVAIAAFAAATVAESDPIKTATAAVMFGWSAYVVPFLFVLSPELMMQGSALAVVHAAAAAVGGVWLVSVGVIGYFTRPLDPARRVGFGAAGLALLLPAGAFAGAGWSDIGGLALAAALIGYEVVAVRRTGSLRAG